MVFCFERTGESGIVWLPAGGQERNGGMITIAVLDFGFGSVLSLEQALLAAGAEVQRLENGRTLHAFDAAVFTAVGRFGAAMRAFEEAGMFSGVWNMYEELRRPILGIGLGMHMLASGSQESPGQPGLNILPGTARDLSSRMQHPSAGWHRMRIEDTEDPLFEGLPEYVEVHCTQDQVILPANIQRGIIATYMLDGDESVMALRRKGVWGLQFDPVRSGEAGQQVLRNFVALVESLTNPEPDEESG